MVLVGVSSYESAYAVYTVTPSPVGGTFLPFDYEPTSIGSLVALDLHTGDILWQTFTTTSAFSGASVWGSSPSIDEKRGQVFIGTGQNFDAPPQVLACAATAYEENADPEVAAEAARICLEPYPDNLFDSIIAIDIKTGKINWGRRIVGYDVWHVACLFGLDFICPNPTGADADFGQSPIFYSIETEAGTRDVVGVGQKSGMYWVLDAASGDLLWSTRVSPGGIAGGIQWGSAYDGERIYTSSANSDNTPYVIDGNIITGGIWSALDPATGEILWQTADPNNAKSGGAATVANGVVYVCSWDSNGTLYALDAASGEILWQFESGGSCNSGAAVSRGVVFWGSGYASDFGAETSADYFRAFALPKKK